MMIFYSHQKIFYMQRKTRNKIRIGDTDIVILIQVNGYFTDQINAVFTGNIFQVAYFNLRKIHIGPITRN
ncbi:hypothetical protein D3C81_2140290 [compost metagenome]